MVTRTGHIGIHEGADGRTDVRTYVVRTYGRWWRHGYKTTMVLRARAPSARAELRYNIRATLGKWAIYISLACREK